MTGRIALTMTGKSPTVLATPTWIINLLIPILEYAPTYHVGFELFIDIRQTLIIFVA